jgi:hypothetical protein
VSGFRPAVRPRCDLWLRILPWIWLGRRRQDIFHLWAEAIKCHSETECTFFKSITPNVS